MTGRPRLAFLSYSSGEFDARTQRMARSAVQAGFDVVVYARLQDGLPEREERDGYRLIRVEWHGWLAIPVLRIVARRRLAARAARRRALAARPGGPPPPKRPPAWEDFAPPPAPPAFPSGAFFRTLPRRLVADARRNVRLTIRVAKLFPLRPLAWANALGDMAEPADIWHGMWAGSLPALEQLSRRHGGRTIYDSRDVYMESRDFAKAPRPARAVLAWIERRWARGVDVVLTVNEPYADLIERGLGVARPPIVMNCSARWTPPDPAPDLIRAALGIPAGTKVALYQGQLTSERGIEQAMDAILEIPDAVLVLLGFGKWLPKLERQVTEATYAGRVFLLPAVPPDELLLWTASADVSVMAIAPTTVNHRFTTPQKLFESLAAGVPVVASDLPGMAAVVRASGCGELVDPLSPASVGAGIRTILDRSDEERAAHRRRILEVAHRDYSWEAQVDTLMGVYARQLAASGRTLPERRAA